MGKYSSHLRPLSYSISQHTPTPRRLSTTNTSKAPTEFTTLCSKGRLKQAIEAFRPEIWSDPPLFFSLLLKSCIQTQSLSLTQQLHSLIVTSGCATDKSVTNYLLNAYAKIGDLRFAVKLFDVLPRRNVMSCNILIGGFVQNGDLESARQVFDEMPDRNVATWNVMVMGLTQFEFNEEGLSLFSQMRSLGFMPDVFTLGSVFKGCAGLKDLSSGRQVHGYVVKCGLELNSVVGNSLAHMYMKSGSLGEGEKVIEAMPITNVVAYNTLIAGRAQNGFSEGALDQYNKLKMGGLDQYNKRKNECNDIYWIDPETCPRGLKYAKIMQAKKDELERQVEELKLMNEGLMHKQQMLEEENDGLFVKIACRVD